MINSITLTENGAKLHVLDYGDKLKFKIGAIEFNVDRKEFMSALNKKPKTMQQITAERSERWSKIEDSKGEETVQ